MIQNEQQQESPNSIIPQPSSSSPPPSKHVAATTPLGLFDRIRRRMGKSSSHKDVTPPKIGQQGYFSSSDYSSQSHKTTESNDSTKKRSYSTACTITPESFDYYSLIDDDENDLISCTMSIPKPPTNHIAGSSQNNFIDLSKDSSSEDEPLQHSCMIPISDHDDEAIKLYNNPPIIIPNSSSSSSTHLTPTFKKKKIAIPSFLFSDDDLKYDRNESKTIIPILYIEDKFLIKFTKPFWTVVPLDNEILKDSKHSKEFYLDFTKPIFTVVHFLKLVHYFNFNQHKIMDKSKFINNLKDLIILLRPYSTIFVDSENSMEYLLQEIRNALAEDKKNSIYHTHMMHLDQDGSVKYVNNLQFLTLEYIQLFSQFFEGGNVPHKRKNIRKLQQAEHILKKEFGSRTIRCFDERDKRLYFEGCHSLYNFMDVHFDTKKFEFYNPNGEKRDIGYGCLPLFHSMIESLIISKLFFNGGEYKGDVISTGMCEELEEEVELSVGKHLPHGYGTWKFVNGNDIMTYSGQWKFGKKDGLGTFQMSNLIYEGQWSDDQVSGYGVLKVTDGYHKGSIYYGEFENGKRNGKGVQFYMYNQDECSREDDTHHHPQDLIKDEYGHEFYEWYRGEWRNDKRDGHGEYMTKYEWKIGEWKERLRDGFGCIREFVHESTRTITDSISYYLTFEKFKQTSKKPHIPSTLLPFLDHWEKLKQLNAAELIIALGAQSKTAKRTIHMGYCFRSKLEAKWAKFFESCSIPFFYEPYTFKLRDGTEYTPDFYLPLQNFWIEIKPHYPTEEERVKAQLLADLLNSSNSNENLEVDNLEFISKHNNRVQPKPRIFLLFGDEVSPPFVRKFQVGAKAIEFFKQTQIERVDGMNKNTKKVTPPRQNVTFATKEPLGWCQCSACGKISLEYRCQPPCCQTTSDGIVEEQMGDTLSKAYQGITKLDFDEWMLNSPGSDRSIVINSISSPGQPYSLTTNNQQLPRRKSKFF
nr:unnamed protein product [Naegleria fowleri]